MANDNNKVEKIVTTSDVAKGHQMQNLSEGHQLVSHKQAERTTTNEGKQMNLYIQSGRQWENKGRQPFTVQPTMSVTPASQRPADPKPIKKD